MDESRAESIRRTVASVAGGESCRTRAHKQRLTPSLNLPILRYNGRVVWDETALFVTIFLGGAPLIWELLIKLRQGQFDAGLLAGISIVTSLLLHEYLAGSIVVSAVA